MKHEFLTNEDLRKSAAIYYVAKEVNGEDSKSRNETMENDKIKGRSCEEKTEEEYKHLNRKVREVKRRGS